MTDRAGIRTPRTVRRPWGFEEIWDCGGYIMKRLHVDAGHRLSLHFHRDKVETLVVHAGFPVITIDGLPQSYGPGDVLHIPAMTIHRVAAPAGDVELFEASTTELEDVVRLEDDYERADIKSPLDARR